MDMKDQIQDSQRSSGSNPRDNPTNPVVPDLDDMTKMGRARVELPKQLENQCKWLEEKFRAMESANYLCGVDAKKLSLVPNLVLPPKFKTPEFEKYNGTSCPEAHITMFYRRMTGYAFMKNYSHVIGMTSNRITLQNMEKKQSESFRKYVQRCREVATQVQPPLLKNETTMLLINTLKAPFINHMLGSATKSFSDVVMSREMIENAVRSGKIDAGENTKRSAPRKKENELIKMFIKMGILRFNNPSGPNVAGNSLPSHFDQGLNVIIKSGGKRTKTDVAEVKSALKWVWQKMIDVGLIIQDSEEVPKRVRSYCEFHAKEGHEIQECTEFRALVKSLMDNKELEFFEDVKGSEEGDVSASKEGSNGERLQGQPPGGDYFTTKKRGELSWYFRRGPGYWFFTRNGRHYDPTSASTEPIKGKTLAVEHKKEKMTRLESPVNEPITENEAKEFLKLLKHRGMGSTKALHITTSYKGYTLPGVLIDNGSALNVLPLSTLNKLPVDSSHMKTCQNIIRAFDGTERRVMRRIEIPLLIGLNRYELTKVEKPESQKDKTSASDASRACDRSCGKSKPTTVGDRLKRPPLVFLCNWAIMGFIEPKWTVWAQWDRGPHSNKIYEKWQKLDWDI
ncbi:hypothetical protein EPI10_005303 [Gossypium australe]|uniref:Retrotransposon gag domain-containing protein n=1 Tax=Gossypium australe TaxID=47621 RepID=A0A5B6WQ79_9ROSI|nr:hypothetical protein EPI10_005303 [Gossypium australe]